MSRPLAVTVLATALALAATGAPPATANTAAPDIPVNAVRAHLEKLEAIAERNGGNRAAGSPGYQASLDYLRGKLDAAGYVTSVQRFDSARGETYNLIAETRGGDPDNVVMFGSHLDSVDAGPGINDNGTGSAAVLQAALAWAATGRTPRNRLRFAWWGAEELGLIGSKHYMEARGLRETDRIRRYLNFDMIGSPNPGYFVYDDDPNGTEIRDLFTSYFRSVGVELEPADIRGRSDHAAFLGAQIPTGGLFTGAEEEMSQEQARRWKGTAGQPYDRCYHRSCDTLRNVDLTALDRNSDAIAYAVWEYAGRRLG